MARTKFKHVRREVTRHGKVVYYFRPPGQTRTRLPGTPRDPVFVEAYAKALASDFSDIPAVIEKHRRLLVDASLLRLLTRTRDRAKQKGREFDLTLEWLKAEVGRTGYKCPISSIPFCTETKAASKYRPFWPSVDRIDTTRGYTTDNCRVVTLAVNVMLNEWGMTVARKVAAGILKAGPDLAAGEIDP